MNAPSAEYFDRKAQEVFAALINTYHYQLKQASIKPFSVQHIYTHPGINRQIEISNATYASDYGFSFSIVNLATGSYNILYHVPHEQQDPKGLFLLEACTALFSSPEALNLIMGKPWQEIKHILFQR